MNKKHMNVTRLISLLSMTLLSTACAFTGGAIENDKPTAQKYPADQISLLGFIATGQEGEKQYVHDRQQNNAEGTAIIKLSYLAASGKQCRAYYWLPSGVQERAGGHNLNVACRTITGQWQKERTLSNIEVLLEKEPVGYVLH